METIESRRRQTEREVVFDWRFAELMRAGVPAHAAWLLASDQGVDVRRVERLLGQGCPVDTLLRILL
jgi:hypothetical protein